MGRRKSAPAHEAPKTTWLLSEGDHRRRVGAALRQTLLALIDLGQLTSFEAAAKQMGFSGSALGNVMRGERPLGPYHIYTLNRVYGITADWLLLGDPVGLRADLRALVLRAPSAAEEVTPAPGDLAAQAPQAV
jgi:transcriptional regulator with XRE-family HTH domain